MSQSTILPIDCETAICYNLSATLVSTIKTGTFVTFKGCFFFTIIIIHTYIPVDFLLCFDVKAHG